MEIVKGKPLFNLYEHLCSAQKYAQEAEHPMLDEITKIRETVEHEVLNEHFKNLDENQQ